MYVLFQHVCRRTKNFTTIDQQNYKTKTNLHLEPHDYQIYNVHVIKSTYLESLTFLKIRIRFFPHKKFLQKKYSSSQLCGL